MAALQKLRNVLAEINRPSAQRDSWFAWASAQLAHVAIGVALGGALAFVVTPIWAFAVASMGYALAKEVPDFLQSRTWANARDCVQDALFVTAGAALGVAWRGGHDRLFFVALIAAAIGLGLGVSARLKGAGNAGG